jgi:hypothetical protein
MSLKLNYINDCLINVYFSENNKYIGDFVMLVDGYFYYQPNKDLGVFSSQTLVLISDKLIELNNFWDEKIKKDLNKYK